MLKPQAFAGQTPEDCSRQAFALHYFLIHRHKFALSCYLCPTKILKTTNIIS